MEVYTKGIWNLHFTLRKVHIEYKMARFDFLCSRVLLSVGLMLFGKLRFKIRTLCSNRVQIAQFMINYVK